MPELRTRASVALGEPAVVLDIVTAAVFHTLLAFAAYLHFAGHNSPGGGFIAGLVVGSALTLRFLTGRPQIQSRIRVENVYLLGAGVLLCAGTALTSLVLGNSLLEHQTWEYDVAVLGTIKFTSALFFDTGILLVVIGVVAMLLEVLGSEGDDPEKVGDEEVTA